MSSYEALLKRDPPFAAAAIVAVVGALTIGGVFFFLASPELEGPGNEWRPPQARSTPPLASGGSKYFEPVAVRAQSTARAESIFGVGQTGTGEARVAPESPWGLG